ncbi:MAG: triose-phosphate isomerase [Phycisphaerales bacterium]|nr:triose-phosphate isomerase [Phycisphaerales bacterium]
MARTTFIGGNWKMNTDRQSARALAEATARAAANLPIQVAIFPPFPYLIDAAAALAAAGSPFNLLLGAQDVCHHPNGAFTGGVSIAMLHDVGVRVALTGHSERRHVFNESDELVNAKTRAILKMPEGGREAGEGQLACILCIGETLEQRRAGQTDAVNRRQLRAGLAGIPGEAVDNGRLTIAYEPVWAIGTGVSATSADAQDAHAKIRAELSAMYSHSVADGIRIQYGGSVKASSVAELLAQPDIDGALVGGASLSTDEFPAILRAGAAKAAGAIA